MPLFAPTETGTDNSNVTYPSDPTCKIFCFLFPSILCSACLEILVPKGTLPPGGTSGCGGWRLGVIREAKSVWKVGEVWVGHREKTERDKGVGGGEKQVLWCLRAALC